ncbi:hypothetical protein GQ457_16G028320 [Hibiscus cannabinus]
MKKGLCQGDPISPSLFIIVVEALHLLLKRVEELEWIEGDGHSVLFWEELWCGEAPLRVSFPRLYGLVKEKGLTVATVFGNGDSSNIDWDFVFSRYLLERELPYLSSIKKLVEDIKLGFNSSDKIIWMQDKTLSTCLLPADLPQNSGLSFVSGGILSGQMDRSGKISLVHNVRSNYLEPLSISASPPSVVLEWFPPEAGAVKFNVDGACNSIAVGCGGVLRNCLGDVKALFPDQWIIKELILRN